MKKITVFALIVAAATLIFCACGKKGNGGPDGATGQYDGLDLSAGAEKIFEEVKRRPVVVFDGATLVSGGDVWDAFYADVLEGTAANVSIANYYTLDRERCDEEYYEAEKDNYPQIFLSVLHFDGVEFELIGQDDVGGSLRSSGSFKYLKKFEGDLPSGAVYKRYTEYVLVDDDTLTHEEIMKSFYSSNIRDNVRSRTVYSDYHD